MANSIVAPSTRNTVFSSVTGQYPARMSTMSGERCEMLDTG